jgi:chaperonin GroES
MSLLIYAGIVSGIPTAAMQTLAKLQTGEMGPIRLVLLLLLPEETRPMDKIRPLQDRVVIRRVNEEEKTAGGIIIPDTAKEPPLEGEVVAVGNGKVREDGTVRALEVKVGDRVLFGKYTGSDVILEGEKRLVVREDDILGIIAK